MAMPDRANITVELNADRTPVSFTAEQFATMARAGLFDAADGKTELVRGVLYQTQARFAPHATNREELAFVLEAVFQNAPEWCVSRGARVRLDDRTVAAPDVAVLRRDAAGGDVLEAGAVALAIEVVDGFEPRLGTMLADYARAGVPRAWVVEVGAAATRVCEVPGPGGYAARRVVRFGEPLPLAPLVTAEVVIPEGGFA